MSVYRPKNSPFYHFDFQVRGRRFHGSAGTANRRDAEKIEDRERKRAASLTASAAGPLTIDAAAGLYWTQVGRFHAAAETTWTNLERLVTYFGKPKLLADITTADVAELVAWRRGHRVKGRKKAMLIAPATVNRSTIEPLQRIFGRAKNVWKQKFEDEPDWKALRLKEPQERVRVVRPAEESLLESVPEDYLAVVLFARAAGLRQRECLLRKDQVDLTEGRLYLVGKGGKKIVHPITSEMRAILIVAMQNPTDRVFIYKRQSKRASGVDRFWHPITASGLKSAWRRARKRPGGIPADLRFHDLRHDFATRLLRETGNLRLVQKALHHASIETTARYAHVLDEDLAAGMEAAATARAKARKCENVA